MKQVDLQVARIGLPRFPLGKTGGLIEAARPPARWTSSTRFRWVKPAASLKQGSIYFHHAPALGVSAG